LIIFDQDGVEYKAKLYVSIEHCISPCRLSDSSPPHYDQGFIIWLKIRLYLPSYTLCQYLLNSQFFCILQHHVSTLTKEPFQCFFHIPGLHNWEITVGSSHPYRNCNCNVAALFPKALQAKAVKLDINFKGFNHDHLGHSQSSL
jgi:hypothetical protein